MSPFCKIPLFCPTTYCRSPKISRNSNSVHVYHPIHTPRYGTPESGGRMSSLCGNSDGSLLRIRFHFSSRGLESCWLHGTSRKGKNELELFRKSEMISLELNCKISVELLSWNHQPYSSMQIVHGLQVHFKA